MAVSPRQYAEALHGALEGKKEGERTLVLKRFLDMLRKRKEEKKIDRILAHYERLEIEKGGKVKVHLEAPGKISEAVKAEIEKIIGKDAVFSERLNLGLLAGIRIMVNDTILIDATAARRLGKLHTNISQK